MRYKFPLFLLAALFASASCGSEDINNGNNYNTLGPNVDEAAVKAALKNANEAAVVQFLAVRTKDTVVGKYEDFRTWYRKVGGQLDELKVAASIQEIWDKQPDDATLQQYTEGWPLDTIDTKEVTKALAVLPKMFDLALPLHKITAYESDYGGTLNSVLKTSKVTSGTVESEGLEENAKKGLEALLALRNTAKRKPRSQQTIQQFLDAIKQYARDNKVPYESVCRVIEALESLARNKKIVQNLRNNKVDDLMKYIKRSLLKIKVGLIKEVAAQARGNGKLKKPSAATTGQAYKTLFQNLHYPEEKLEDSVKEVAKRINRLEALKQLKDQINNEPIVDATPCESLFSGSAPKAVKEGVTTHGILDALKKSLLKGKNDDLDVEKVKKALEEAVKPKKKAVTPKKKGGFREFVNRFKLGWTSSKKGGKPNSTNDSE